MILNMEDVEAAIDGLNCFLQANEKHKCWCEGKLKYFCLADLPEEVYGKIVTQVMEDVWVSFAHIKRISIYHEWDDVDRSWRLSELIKKEFGGGRYPKSEISFLQSMLDEIEKCRDIILKSIKESA